MFELLGVPPQALFGQVMLGLINGAFYAMLSLGLAVIFGLLGIVNFAHGALYMLGAFAAWIMLDRFGINYWYALFLAPLTVGALGAVIGSSPPNHSAMNITRSSMMQVSFHGIGRSPCRP